MHTVRGNSEKAGFCGQITIFLSLIMVLVLSLILTAAEAARIQAVKIQIENITDMGLDSIFAEYDRGLLEKYDLFFVDGACGGSALVRENMGTRLRSYMEYNYMPEKGEIHQENADLWRARPEKVAVSGIMRATDYGGAVFREQAVAYMKDRTGIDKLTWLFDMLRITGGTDSGGQTFTEKSRENRQDRKTLEKEAESLPDKSAGETEDPSAAIEELKKTSILNLVLKHPEQVSNKKITLTDAPSRRKFQKEEIPLEEDNETSQKITELLFDEYILEKFPSALDTPAGGVLDYEAEYVLMGKDSDIRNLEGTTQRLLLMREGANFLYLMGDSAKCSEAYAMAAALAGYTGMPPLIKAVQMSILLAWAYGESIIDVRYLLSGGRLPFIKTAKDWQLSLENLPQLQKHLDRQGNGDSSAPGYEDYLRVLLYAGSGDEKPMRCLDIIEKELQMEEGAEGLRMENCIAGAAVSMTWKAESLFFSFPFMKSQQYLEDGYYFSIEKSYSY
ncbi:DUF5702 domain-containing protein [Anaerobium acetethylicum]|uniref:Uncharacterized protein n=1 Tax=Anaerobium acetethylicum TaxID=1619234 RepID=A0A1D3TRK1_9FIRM|nr:DUF5702 domain-containing protein [Anaerobium acetethylicum]SCP96362.1 hypothetical protein SAMN05421730_1004133 [Anaerobium acetethylicum]